MWVRAAISVGQVNEHVAVKAWAIIVGVVSFVIYVFYLLLEHAPRTVSALRYSRRVVRPPGPAST